jgi:hypothetical protein
VTFTWDEIRKRSAHKIGSINTHCFDCELNFFSIGMSCDKHALNQSEQDERASRISKALSKSTPCLRNHPLLQVIPKNGIPPRSTTSDDGSTD